MTAKLTLEDWELVMLGLSHTGAAYAQVATRQALSAADASRHKLKKLAKDRQAESDESAALSVALLELAARIREAM